MFHVNNDILNKIQDGSINLSTLQLVQKSTHKGKTWEIIIKGQPMKGSVVAEHPNLQKVIEEISNGNPISNSNLKELSEDRNFQEFAKHAAQITKITKKILMTAAERENNISFSPSDLTLEESLLKEIKNALPTNKFNLEKHPIISITRLSRPTDRNRILRIEFKGSKEKVIFKESHPMTQGGKSADQKHYDVEELRMAFHRLALDWAGLEFVHSLQSNLPLCPECYGGNREHRFILIQDLGKHVNLIDTLFNKEDPEAHIKAEEVLYRYMTTLGSLHSHSHFQIQRYREVLHSINPNAPENVSSTLADETITNLKNYFDILQISLETDLMKKLENEIHAVVSNNYDQNGTFATVVHGDPSPENIFDFPDKLLLIDFEMTSIESALIDATHPRMGFPNAGFAGAIPNDVLDRVETLYRKELAIRIPEASDEKAYSGAYASACVMHIIKQDLAYLGRFIDHDEEWGISSVWPRVISHFEVVIDVTKNQASLQATHEVVCLLLERLKDRWGDAKPLPYYPAFN